MQKMSVKCGSQHHRNKMETYSDKIQQVVISNERSILVLTANNVHVTVRDIVSDEGKLKSWSTLQNNNLTGAEYFVLMSIFDAIPLEWQTLLKDMSNYPPRNNESHDNILPTSSKEVYRDLIRKT